MTMFTSSVRSWASIPSNALSKLNQKLISWDAVPEETSRVSLVTACMDLIHELTCPCRVLRKELSLRSFAGICEILGL